MVLSLDNSTLSLSVFSNAAVPVALPRQFFEPVQYQHNAISSVFFRCKMVILESTRQLLVTLIRQLRYFGYGLGLPAQEY